MSGGADERWNGETPERRPACCSPRLPILPFSALAFHRSTALAFHRMRSLLLLAAASTLAAQVPEREFAARRDALAKRIDSGVVIAFGGRTPITDFGPFRQLPAFKYLTNFDEPDAAFVMVVRGGKGASTVFLTPSDPRRAFYYGWRPDSAAVLRIHSVNGRSFTALASVMDSLATTGLPFYTLDDFEDADFARADSLTRGRSFVRAVAARHAGLVVKDAHGIVDELRAKKSPAEVALLKKAAE